MSRATQFTRNADGYYLQVELKTHALSFLLASTNEDHFYELHIPPDTIPHPLRTILPTLQHLFIYIRKNAHHPKAFRIDQHARIHIAVPQASRSPATAVFSSAPITNSSIIPQELLSPQPQQTPEPVIEKPLLSTQEQEDKICREIEGLLMEGCEMCYVKKKYRLSNKTATKMMGQFQRHKAIFSPRECALIRQTKRAKKLIQEWVRVDPALTRQNIQNRLNEHNINRSDGFVEKHLQSTIPCFYSDESGSGGHEVLTTH